MIFYLYHGTYKSNYIGDTAALQPMFRLRVHLIGDKYTVNGLSDLAENRFSDSLSAHWNTKAFTEVAEVAYSTEMPDTTISESVLGVAKEHHLELFSKGPDHARFKAFARDAPKFMFDMIQAIGGVSLAAWAGSSVVSKVYTSGNALDSMDLEELRTERELVEETMYELDKKSEEYKPCREQLTTRAVA